MGVLIRKHNFMSYRLKKIYESFECDAPINNGNNKMEMLCNCILHICRCTWYPLIISMWYKKYSNHNAVISLIFYLIFTITDCYCEQRKMIKMLRKENPNKCEDEIMTKKKNQRRMINASSAAFSNNIYERFVASINYPFSIFKFIMIECIF